jgi:hypothetical protein
LDAKTASLIVSNNLGPIMKRIRKAVENGKNSIGDIYAYQKEDNVSVNQNQKKILEELGYKVEFYPYYHDFKDEFDHLDVLVEW